LHARKRREIDSQQFFLDAAEVRPEQCVSLDETAVDRHTARRNHGWAAKRKRANVMSFFIRGKRSTLEMDMSCRGALTEYFWARWILSTF